MGRSRCDSCGHEISIRDNIPLISWIALRGRCRFCGEKITPIYAGIEIICTILLLIVTFHSSSLLEALTWILFVALGVALSAIDIKLHRLPDALTGASALSLLLLIIAQSIANSDSAIIFSAIITGTIVFTCFFLLRVISRGGMGLGDVKFSFSTGLLTGSYSTTTTIVSLYATFIASGIVALWLILRKKGNSKSRIPLGPYLFAGVVVSYLLTTSSHLP